MIVGDSQFATYYILLSSLPISDTRQADWQPEMLYHPTRYHPTTGLIPHAHTHFRYFFGIQTPSKMVLEH